VNNKVKFYNFHTLLVYLVLFAGITFFMFLASFKAYASGEDEVLRRLEKGSELFVKGSYQKSLDYFKKSLEHCESLKSEECILVSYIRIGQALKELRRYEDALIEFSKAIKISIEIGSIEAHAVCLYEIGGIHDLFYRYEKAINFYKDSLKAFKKISSIHDEITVLNSIGLIYSDMGQYSNALLHYEEAIKLVDKKPNSILRAGILNNIGRIYLRLKNYKNALQYFSEAFLICNENNRPVCCAVTLLNLGDIHNSLGEIDKAIYAYESAKKIAEKEKIQELIFGSLDKLGGIYFDLGRYQDSLKNIKLSLNVAKQLGNFNIIHHSLLNLCSIYLQIGNITYAKEYYNNAIKIEKGRNIDNRILLEYKKREEAYKIEILLASQDYKKALKLLNNLGDPRMESYAYKSWFHRNLGLSMKYNGNIDEASREFLKAVLIYEEDREKITGDKLIFLEQRGRIKVYRELVSALSDRFIEGKLVDPVFISYGKDLSSAAFYFSETTKARVLLEKLAETSRNIYRINIPEKLKKSEQSLLNQISAIKSKIVESSKTSDDYRLMLNNRLINLKEDLSKIIKIYREKYPRYASRYYPEPIPPDKIPLKNNEVLIEYAIADEATYIFLVKKSGIEHIFKMNINKDDLNKKVADFLEVIKNYQGLEFQKDMASELYDVLLSNVINKLEKENRLIIVPDGILGVLPFEALTTKGMTSKDDFAFVGDKYEFIYYQSATVLAFQRNFQRSKPKKPLFALGDPFFSDNDPRYIKFKKNLKPNKVDFSNLNKISFRGLAGKRKWGRTTKDEDDFQELSYPPLPETYFEISQIAKVFNLQIRPPDILTGALANETNLMNTKLENYKFIHFATHADLPVRLQRINQPFILLGQVENSKEHDGILSMTEVLGLELNAELVVLSACYTGSGNLVEGEGIISLARAFQYAGANSVIASLWNVRSDMAVIFMHEFYKELKNGKSKIAALKIARSKVRNITPNPFYWSVFILYGEG